ncbi:MAG TPA: DUF885 domain-containing protein, partial [Polyangiaceae bacterium]|nr:DUF885 domain-containing protein [Polyangiaceae bacterium]
MADVYVAEFVARFPERAEGAGLALRHDGLSDNSLTALAEWHAREDELARREDAIDAHALLGRPEWITLGFLREALTANRGARVCRRELWPATHYFGWLDELSDLAASQVVGSEQARRDTLSRFSHVARYLDTEVVNMREGVRLGFTTPRVSVDRVIRQLDALLARPVTAWPLFSPASRDGDVAFGHAFSELLDTQVAPAVRRYRDYLRDEYRARAREDIAITSLPDGAACYRALYRLNTSIDRAPEEVVRIGERAVAQNLAAALAIGRERLGSTDLASLADSLQRAPHFASADEKLAFALATVDRARGAAPRAFLGLPTADVRIEPYPEEIAAAQGDSYRPPSEGRSYGVYRINLLTFAQETRASAEKTVFHETIPGHHVQMALASALPGVHPITKLVKVTAFVEGWARYAEGLAEELELYTSDAARVSRRLWPARGMVVDPGVLVFGWTRERAVAYITEAGWPAAAAQNMVDRIGVRPAQLTAYDSGGLEIMALRQEAERQL